MEQRACLVRAIAIPKINYVARHCWPPPVIIHKLQGFIKDFFWGKRNERRSRPWVQEKHGALSIREGGISIPCVRTELITLDASTVVTWATLVSSRDRLVGNILWGDGNTSPRYITPRYGDDQEQKVLTSLWTTGCKAVAVISGGHVGGLNAQAVWTRAYRFVAKTTVTHSDHGSVTVDARAALDGPTRNELLEETSVNGRSDTTWLKNASVETMSWLFNRKGRRYQLNGASFARGRATLGDTITWSWEDCGVV